MELPGKRAENAAMRFRGWPSLAILPVLVGALVAGSAPAANDITVYRCKDSGGGITLQDEPCPAGQQESARTMTRPKDPPPAPPEPVVPLAAASASPQPDQDNVAPAYAAWPPPPMFECTDYDGTVRFDEEYTPNNRCVPLAVLGYDFGSSELAATCRWIEESCLRVDDETACRQFRLKLKQARSDALHAFTDTAAFRKSEAERLNRIVNESCR
jgi:hypothetical protein